MDRKLLAFVGFAGAVALACSSTTDGAPAAPQDGTAVLGDYTFIVPTELSDVANVQADRVVFPASAFSEISARPKGSVLVGDRSSLPNSQNPQGFLRKVKAVTQDATGTVVTTDPATLLDAAPTIQFQGSFQTPALGNSGPQGLGGAHLTGNGKPISVIDFSGKSLFDKTLQIQVDAQHTVGVQAFAKVNKGTLNFTPSWDVGADVSLLQIKSLHASATGTLDAELEVDAGVKLLTNLDNATFTKLIAQKIIQAQDATLADYTVSLGKMHLGPLPLPVNAHFTAKLACSLEWGGGAEVVIGGKASASLTAGMKYENGKVSPIFDKSAQLTQTGPNWTLDGVTRMQCTIEPRFELNLFDMAMAEVWADGYVDLGGALSCAGKDASGNLQGKFDGLAEVGASAGVHAKVDVFGLYKWEKACTLFDVSASAQTSRTFTLPTGPNSTCTPDNGYVLSPKQPANPTLCFGDSDAGSGPIAGTCTHDVCQAGDRLGQTCDDCTQKVCAKDPYCCDTFWGPSCFEDVKTECGKTCP